MCCSGCKKEDFTGKCTRKKAELLDEDCHCVESVEFDEADVAEYKYENKP